MCPPAEACRCGDNVSSRAGVCGRGWWPEPSGTAANRGAWRRSDDGREGEDGEAAAAADRVVNSSRGRGGLLAQGLFGWLQSRKTVKNFLRVSTKLGKV